MVAEYLGLLIIILLIFGLFYLEWRKIPKAIIWTAITALILIVLLGLNAYYQTAKFQKNLLEAPELFLFKENNRTVLAGFKILPRGSEAASIPLKAEEIDVLNQNINAKQIKGFFAVFAFKPSIISKAAQPSFYILGRYMTKEEIFLILRANDAIGFAAKRFRLDKEKLSSKFTNESLKAVIFQEAALGAGATIPELLKHYKKGKINIYPGSFSLKLLKITPHLVFDILDWQQRKNGTV